MKVSIKPHATWGGDWYTLDYREGGVKGKRIREHVKGWAEAQARAAEIAGTETEPDKPTFPRLRDVAAEYLAWSKKNQAAATYEGKRCRVEGHIIPALGDKRPAELTQRTLDAYGAKLARGSYRDDLLHLQAMIRWMVTRRYAKPLDWKPELPAYKAGIKHLPSAPEILRFIAALKKEQHRTVCTLMLYTALRWNEARNLRWENYRDGTILMKISKTADPELITIPAPCLEWFRANQNLSGFIFSINGGRTCLCNLQRPLKVAFEATGVYMTAHMFRHASATFLYDLTGDIYEVQHHLRHSRVTTSQVYTRYSAVRRRGSVEALVGLMGDVDKVDKS